MSSISRRIALSEPGLSLFTPHDRGYRDIGSAIGAGASIVSGFMGSGAADDAAAAQTAETAQQIAEQRRQYDQTRRDNMPFMTTGWGANHRLAQLLGVGGLTAGAGIPFSENPEYLRIAQPIYDRYAAQYGGGNFNNVPPEIREQAYAEATKLFNAPIEAPDDYGSLLRKFQLSDLDADPVYQSGLKFGLDEGRNAINARAIAGGGYDSGATLKALTQFGNDYASTKANESYNRFNADKANTYNMLTGTSGGGQVAVNNVAAAGQNATNNISQAYGDAANARAASIVGSANAWGSAAQGVNNAYNNYNNSRMLERILRDRGRYPY